MSSLMEHAKIELQAIGYKLDGTEIPPNSWMVESVMELLETFSKQGHSGFSAAECINLFTKLAKFEPLCPLTGEDSEWVNVSSECGNPHPLFQNKRCSRVFKDNTGAYDIQGKVFVEPDGCAYTSKESHVPVTFPYTPKTEYIKVEKHVD